MVRLYTDENFPLPAVEALRQQGHDVLTAYESGRANQAVPDDEVLDFATEQGRVLVTFNRKHFIRFDLDFHPTCPLCDTKSVRMRIF
jgi:predicted nuclease of predicted toxin-antitoxin system